MKRKYLILSTIIALILLTTVGLAMGNKQVEQKAVIAGTVSSTVAEGVIGITKSAAKELASRGITVNAVAPGYIDTDMTKVLSDEQKKSVLDMIPLSRMGSVDDISNAVAFLASDEAAYITGQVISVDGGMNI